MFKKIVLSIILVLGLSSILFATQLGQNGADIFIGNVGISTTTLSGNFNAEIVGTLGYRLRYQAKTASHDVQQNESGTFFSNRGAGGSITFNLPAGIEGLYYRFVRLSSFPIAVFDGTYTMSSDDTGAYTEFVYSSGDWRQIRTVGTWSIS